MEVGLHLKHRTTRAEKGGETLSHTLRPGVDATPEFPGSTEPYDFTGISRTLRIHQGPIRDSSGAWNSVLCKHGTAFLGLRAHFP